MDDGDEPSKQFAIGLGNKVVVIEGAELAKWQAVAAGVESDWIAEMTEKGIDGKALVAKAKAFVAKYAK
jgi:hypothetical protein